MQKSSYFEKIGIDLDDASNGIFLRNRKSGGVSPMSRHQGGMSNIQM
ncbi:AHH domain-containing protein [Falcatimonas sp. MSJ-15]|nr:AHH domain-containing protein [Falcatimonas sp. MSJ-15]